MDTPDLSELVGGAPDQRELMAAQIQALQGKRSLAAYQQGLGTLWQGSGDAALAPAGQGLESSAQGLMADAQHQEQQAGMRQDRQLQRAIEARRNAALEQFHNNETTNQANRVSALEESIHKLRALNTKGGETIAFDPMSGQATTLRSAPPPGAGGGRGGAGAGSLKEADWQKFQRSLDPNTGRGELAANQKRVNAALRLEQLFKDPSGEGIRNLDSREMMELATGLQNLLSPGGHSAGEVEHLVPPATLSSGPVGVMEWLKSEPRGLNQQKFVEKMSHTVAREKQAATDALQKAQYGAVAGASPYFKSDPSRFKSILRGRGLDPDQLDENLLLKQQAAPAMTPTSSAGPTHYLVSPDGKLRIPAGPDGKPLAGAKPEPNPQPPKVASNG